MSNAEQSSSAPRVLSFPSDEIRPVPSFTFALPAGWVSAEVPDALLLAGTPPEWEDKWANMLLQHSRVGHPYDLQIAAADSWLLELGLAPEAKIIDEQVVATRRRTIYMRAASYPAVGDTEPVSQSHMIFFGPELDHPTLDMFKLTCLAPADHLKGFMPEMLNVVASFRFDADPEITDDEADPASTTDED